MSVAGLVEALSWWQELTSMELHVTGELEAKLAHSAAKQGRNPDDFAKDVLARYLEEEARLVEAIELGEDALPPGEYHEQVGQRLQRFLQS